ncbi:YbaB/EbfC family nucleoid-associated protein [Saccharopolyspora gloriosae]|uniref:YbaB/EbfC DNA-binding family protein n=1 Tax=Saccharopolyspora gloriosae TaxID=455344 RepID=A0A840NPP6_9PSEU|nr:hypothetical protein [Saccharopolyspora gloriosae]
MDDELMGSGGSADGLVRARVDPRGRVGDVAFDPRQWERTPRAAAEAAVREAVNAALDDMAAKVAAAGALPGLDAELGRVTEGFERAMDKVAADIDAARRRLGS